MQDAQFFKSKSLYKISGNTESVLQTFFVLSYDPIYVSGKTSKAASHLKKVADQNPGVRWYFNISSTPTMVVCGKAQAWDSNFWNYSFLRTLRTFQEFWNIMTISWPSQDNPEDNWLIRYSLFKKIHISKILVLFLSFWHFSNTYFLFLVRTRYNSTPPPSYTPSCWGVWSI